MRGDQLARQWRVIRTIEASPNGLTAAEVVRPDGAQGTARKRNPSKAYSNNWNRLFCYEGPNRLYQRIEGTGKKEPGWLPTGFHVSIGEGRKK